MTMASGSLTLHTWASDLTIQKSHSTKKIELHADIQDKQVVFVLHFSNRSNYHFPNQHEYPPICSKHTRHKVTALGFSAVKRL